jgi:hypothetical protein
MSSLRELSLCEQECVSGGARIAEFIRLNKIDPMHTQMRYDASSEGEDQIVITGRHSEPFRFTVSDMLEYTSGITGIGAVALGILAAAAAPEIAAGVAAAAGVTALTSAVLAITAKVQSDYERNFYRQ